MFNVVLFAIANTGKQYKCPLTGVWIKYKITNTHTHTEIYIYISHTYMGLPRGTVAKNLPANTDVRDTSSIPWSGKSPGVGNGNPLQLLPGKSHGQRRLECYSAWGRKESGTTEDTVQVCTRAHTHTHYWNIMEYYGIIWNIIQSSKRRKSCHLQ